MFSDSLSSSIFQSGGSSVNSNNIDSQSMMPQPNELKAHLETFKTGVPTF